MKKVFRIFTLAGLSVLMATSCYKEDIENLQNQIDALKGGEIASLASQVASISTTVGQLQSTQTQLQGYISELQKGGQTYKSQIAELQGLDSKLGEKITELKSYADTEIGNARTWVEGTFATLDQMDSLCIVVAAVPSKIGEVQAQLDSLKKQSTRDYEKAVKEAVAASESSIRKWINEQLADYYTIAQIDATLDSIRRTQSLVDSSLTAKVEEQRVALDSAKSQITKAYKEAIKTAIDSLQGKINEKIATDIATAKNALQEQIDNIADQIDEIENRLSQAETDVAALINKIQSVVVIPTYSDGSVRVTGDVDVISFDVRPAEVAQSFVTAYQNMTSVQKAEALSFKIVEVTTKGAAPTVEISGVSIVDGMLSVSVRFTDLPACSMASLRLSWGISEYMTKYFGLYVKPVTEQLSGTGINDMENANGNW